MDATHAGPYAQWPSMQYAAILSRGWAEFLKMRRTTWIMLLLFAAPCWGDAEPVKGGKEKALASEVQDLLFRIQSASESGDGEALLALISVDGILARVEETGCLKSLSSSKRLEVSSALRGVLGLAVRRGNFIHVRDGYEFRRVRAGSGPGRYVAYIWVRENGLLVRKLYVHLERVSERLRVVDATDLRLGLSYAALLGSVIVEAAAATAEETDGPLRVVGEARELWNQGDVEGARDLLLSVEGAELPDLFHAAIQLVLAGIALEMEDPAEVLLRVDRAEAYPYEFPELVGLRASALNDLGRYAEALGQARRYIALTDEDASVAVEVGIACRGLGQSVEAVAAFERAAAMEPMWHIPVVYLALELPEERMGEVAQHFAKVHEVEEWFVEMAQLCLEEGEGLTALRCLVSLLMDLYPGHRLGLFYEGRASYKEDRFEEAALYFEKAIRAAADAGLEGEASRSYFNHFLIALDKAGRPLEAYMRCPDRVYAFRYLAARLVKDARFTALRGLMASAAKNPKLKWDVAFRRSEIDYASMRYGDAIRDLRKLHGQLTRLTPDAGRATADLDYVLSRVEDRLVRALVRTRQLEEGLQIALSAQARLAVHGDASYLPLVVYAHRKDIMNARAAILALVAARQPSRKIFEDEDAASILAGEAYKDLREEHFSPR